MKILQLKVIVIFLSILMCAGSFSVVMASSVQWGQLSSHLVVETEDYHEVADLVKVKLFRSYDKFTPVDWAEEDYQQFRIDLGEKLKELRRDRPKGRVLQGAPFSIKTLTNLEEGNGNIELLSVLHVANLYGVSLSFLLDEKLQIERNTEPYSIAQVTSNLATNIKHFLRLRDLEDRWLKGQPGLSKSSIEKIVIEKRPPKLKVVYAIAKALNVSLFDLLEDPEILKKRIGKNFKPNVTVPFVEQWRYLEKSVDYTYMKRLLAHLQRNSGLTQEAFAKAHGLTRTSFTNRLSIQNHSRVNLEIMVSLAENLQISLFTLLTGIGQDKETQPYPMEAIRFRFPRNLRLIQKQIGLANVNEGILYFETHSYSHFIYKRGLPEISSLANIARITRIPFDILLLGDEEQILHYLYVDFKRLSQVKERYQLQLEENRENYPEKKNRKKNIQEFHDSMNRILKRLITRNFKENGYSPTAVRGFLVETLEETIKSREAILLGKKLIENLKEVMRFSDVEARQLQTSFLRGDGVLLLEGLKGLMMGAANTELRVQFFIEQITDEILKEMPLHLQFHVLPLISA